jgi:hypothetical protein
MPTPLLQLLLLLLLLLLRYRHWMGLAPSMRSPVPAGCSRTSLLYILRPRYQLP